MSKKLDCYIVRDLLPNYVEGLTSSETSEDIKEHLSECESCRSECAAMKKEITFKDKVVNRVKSDDDYVMTFLNRTKWQYVGKGILFSLLFISVLTCFIIDIAMNREFTWSVIVDASVFYFGACCIALLFAKKHRFIWFSLALTVLLIPFLMCLEYAVNRVVFDTPVYWMREIAIPICAIWVVIYWIGILVKLVFKTNLWLPFGVVMILSSVGSLMTNAIASNETIQHQIMVGFRWIDALAYVAVGIVCIYVGHIRKDKKYL